MLKLHLGAFDRILPGWMNTDITPHLLVARVPGLARVLFTAGVLNQTRYAQHRAGVFRQLRYLNVTRRFPFATGTVDAIYISHMLSNLLQTDAAHCVSECHRVLRPGGILRIATLDLDAVVKACNLNYPDIFLNLLFDLRTSRRNKNRHWWHYNEHSLRALLGQAGFGRVERRGAGQGNCPNVALIDSRPDSLFLEGTKKASRREAADFR